MFKIAQFLRYLTLNFLLFSYNGKLVKKMTTGKLAEKNDKTMES